MRRGWWLGSVVAVAAALGASPAAAQEGGSCLTTDPPAVTREPQPLRFGITPRIAGSAGALQQEAAPEDEAVLTRALLDLRPPHRELVLRLNRLFWADGEEGIAEFAALVDRYAAAGLQSEIQVRYHPPEGAEGDIAAWGRFVRSAVRRLGPHPAVTGFSITNEANLPISPNTSDGAYEGVVDALVAGVSVAREELQAIGRPELSLGFNVMWRWSPDSDARFWEEVGAKATPAFRAALDYVGLQVYPGLVWPPAPLPGRSAGQEVAEALTLVRRCYMPKAGLGESVNLWVSENGYATNLGRSEAGQAEALDSTLRWVHRYSGELGVTDYRYFNLRDNDSDGTDLFSAVGLLRDDHSPKPGLATLRGLIGLFGREVPEAGPSGQARLRARVSPRADTHGPRRFVTRGRLVGAPCAGIVRVRFQTGRRTISVRRARVGGDCRFGSSVTFRLPERFAGRRRLRVTVRHPAAPPVRRRVRVR